MQLKIGSFLVTHGDLHRVAALMQSIHPAPALIEPAGDGVVEVSIMDPQETNGMLTATIASILLRRLDEQLVPKGS